jgi:pimeloyl-ACP methyl ester carboxylesterase
MLFTEYGDASSPVVVLQHGGGLSDWSFRAAAELLCPEYRVITPVIDGHGADAGTTFVSIEDSAAKLIAYIDTNCGSHVRAIAGLSLGAQIVVEALSQRRELTDCALVESALVIPMKAAAWSAPSYKMFSGLFQQEWFARMQACALQLPDELFEEYFTDSKKMSAESLVNITRSNAAYTLKAAVSQTQAKTLIVAGERELSIMLRSAKKLQDMIQGSKLYIAPGLRHGEFSLKHIAAYVETLKQLMQAP